MTWNGMSIKHAGQNCWGGFASGSGLFNGVVVVATAF